MPKVKMVKGLVLCFCGQPFILTLPESKTGELPLGHKLSCKCPCGCNWVISIRRRQANVVRADRLAFSLKQAQGAGKPTSPGRDDALHPL